VKKVRIPTSRVDRALDPGTGALRDPVTADYVRYAKLVLGLPHLAAQSTAFVPSDVPSGISDSHRLFLGFLHCEKPVVTGAFSAEAFRVMRNLQLAVRGAPKALGCPHCMSRAPKQDSVFRDRRKLLVGTGGGVKRAIISRGTTSPPATVGERIRLCVEGLGIGHRRSPCAPF
jgi:hypothetical protein